MRRIVVSIKKIAGWVVALGAVSAAAIWAPEPANEPAHVPATAPQGSKDSVNVAADSQSRFEALPARETLGERRGELFSSRTWAPPRAPAPKRAAPTAPSAGPTAPPMPYRVAGNVVHEGGAEVVLAKGDRVVTVREGDTLEDGYRVEAINSQAVTLVYVPLDVAQQVPVIAPLELDVPARSLVAAAPAAAEPQASVEHRLAQLRFEGPARIRAGDAFSVALKVTSHEAVRSAPLQLSFDAERLQAVDVRRGGFFADGTFSYRINPAGSIFIGASGNGAVPADAEFFVVTFKPVRPGATELKLSSVLLQGAAGRAIAHDAPAAFRASIVQ
jgi:hypothetical protein